MKRNFLKASLLILLGSYAAAGLSACNTVEGAGRDVKATGSSIEDSAARAKN